MPDKTSDDMGAFREDALNEQDAKEAQEAGAAATDTMMAGLLTSMGRLATDEARRKEVTMMQVMGGDDQARAARQKAIDFARASVALEGFTLSPEVEAINRRYIDGELPGDEHSAAIKAAVLPDATGGGRV